MTKVTTPWLAEHLNKYVKLNINLNNHENFQAMHIEIAKDFAYTIIAKFQGNEKGNSFEINQIDFKFINITGIEQGLHIHNVEYKDKGEMKIFQLFIKPFNVPADQDPKELRDYVKNYTFTFKKKIIVNEENILDIHMDESFYELIGFGLLIKGRQCRSSVYY